MLLDVIYNTVRGVKAQSDNKYMDNTDTVMKANINKYLEELKLIEVQNINFVSPTQQDIILYLIYLLYDQKHNDAKCVECMKETLCDKLSRDILTMNDVIKVIDNYKLRMELN